MGMNLNGISDSSPQLPFLDLAKQSRFWAPDVSTFDVDGRGWLERLPAGKENDTHFVFLTDSAERPAPAKFRRLVVRSSGKGSFVAGWGVSIDQAASSPGRTVIAVQPGGSHSLRITQTDANDPLRLTVVPEAYAGQFDGGALFNPTWTERVKNLRAFRFMDWMDTNDSTVAHWSERPEVEDASWSAKGVPVEVMVRLANELGVDPWFNMPHLADDDYVRKFAAYVRDHLKPELKAYVEYSNEVWNWQFKQAQHAKERGRALWGDVSTGWVQYNGTRAARTCDVWKNEVFGAGKGRVHCTIGAQTGWLDIADETLDCPAWRAQGNGACYEHGIDSVAITGYFTGCMNGRVGGEDLTATVRGWAKAGAAGLTKALEQVRDGRHLVNSKGQRCDDTASNVGRQFAKFKELADARGLAVVAYEGGSHVSANGFPGMNDADVVRLLIEVNRSATMGEFYRSNFRQWRENGGTLYMHFSDFGVPSKYGSWGALESLEQATSPKWKAIQETNGLGCWWSGC
jgi:hypothetical protein